MFVIRNKSFATHLGINGRFWEISDRKYCIQIDKSDDIYLNMKYLFLGFRNYNEMELKDKMYKELSACQISSAYNVSTFCNYQKGKYYINSKIVNRNVYLFPDLETKKNIGLHIYDDRSIDVPYDIFINEVSDIWEERTPIEGFKFDVEPVVYLKKDGVWLVKE